MTTLTRLGVLALKGTYRPFRVAKPVATPYLRHLFPRKDNQMKSLIRPSLLALAAPRRPFRVAKRVAIPYLGHLFTRRTIK